jgi:iron-sulfur cluster assembly protein
MALTLSERAAAEIKRMISQQQLPDETALRVSVVGGGCSGFEYRLAFENQINSPEDTVTESQGVSVVVDQKSARLLGGTEIDIHEGLDKRGFVFNNPLAVRTCGCGTSFQV